MNTEIRIAAGTSRSDSDTGFAETPISDDCSLNDVLSAWNDATDRLQQTHEVLQTEVSRLRHELEVKNHELARENRLADLGRMASHVAHEVRNSLVPVTLYMSLLKRRLTADPESLTILAKVEAGFSALEVTVNDLLNFTSHREPEWSTFSVEDLVTDVCDSLRPQLDAQKILCSVDIPHATTLAADREMLRRAILNLVLNSVEAMPEGGELSFTSVEGPSGFELEIADSGPGLPLEESRRVFDPFFTTKSDGTGLGLAIVQRIAEAHGGRVNICNCPEGGAAFTIEIPRRAMRAAA